MTPATAGLDERAAVEIMGWAVGGPDDDYWILADPLPGQGSKIRATRTSWRPTTDPACAELLLHELRSRGLEARVEESLNAGSPGWHCAICSAESAAPLAAVTAPTRGLAIVCGALACVRHLG